MEQETILSFKVTEHRTVKDSFKELLRLLINERENYKTAVKFNNIIKDIQITLVAHGIVEGKIGEDNTIEFINRAQAANVINNLIKLL